METALSTKETGPEKRCAQRGLYVLMHLFEITSAVGLGLYSLSFQISCLTPARPTHASQSCFSRNLIFHALFYT